MDDYYFLQRQVEEIETRQATKLAKKILTSFSPIDFAAMQITVLNLGIATNDKGQKTFDKLVQLIKESS